MRSFTEFLNEGFVTAVHERDIEIKRKYVDQVWNLLQHTYAKIGGIKGSGFSNKDDMIANIPMWKLYVQGGKVKVCMLYKDRGGRKGVAVATDGSKKAMSVLSSVIKDDFKVSFGEYSKGMLVFIFKNANLEVLRPYILTIDSVRAMFPDEEIIAPTDKFVEENLGPNDQTVYKKYSQYRQYFYVRKIGTELFLKMAIGTPRQTIV